MPDYPRNRGQREHQWGLPVMDEPTALRMVFDNANNPSDDKFKTYAWDVRFHLGNQAAELGNQVYVCRTLCNGDRKKFTTRIAPLFSPLMKEMAFKVLDGTNPYDVVRDTILAHCGSAEGVDKIRGLIGGVRW